MTTGVEADQVGLADIVERLRGLRQIGEEWVAEAIAATPKSKPEVKARTQRLLFGNALVQGAGNAATDHRIEL